MSKLVIERKDILSDLVKGTPALDAEVLLQRVPSIRKEPMKHHSSG